ncbi:MAG TPA: GNAT family N-acetyltransferase [Polyangiaceae bacterium]|nr:GNAT family N-acetyltransferase [Polyangiaceae bacterium]
MIVRAATIDDARAIGTIHVETWRAAYAGIVPADYLAALSIDKRESQWRTSLATPGRPTLVAERDGLLIGWCTFGKSRHKDVAPDAGELYALYVAEAHWSTGAGRALWLEVRRSLASDGHEDVIVSVLRDNRRAIRFYEKAGFVLDPETEAPIEVGGASLMHVLMRCPL